MKIVVVGCTHAGTAAVVNLKELHPESEITIYEKNDNLSFLSCGIALNVGGVIKETKNLFYNSPENLAKMGVVTNMKHEVLDIDFENKKVILLTAHRRENWGEPMKEIFKAVNELVIKNDDVDVIFPMHKNPLIREIAAEEFKGIENRVHLIEPLEYVDFANLMAKCYLIMTDSGGIQEEAPALGKPVMVLRTETERPEAIEAGTVKLAGVKMEDIFNIANELVNDKGAYENMAHAANPYGDGKACERIVNHIVEYFN